MARMISLDHRIADRLRASAGAGRPADLMIIASDFSAAHVMAMHAHLSALRSSGIRPRILLASAAGDAAQLLQYADVRIAPTSLATRLREEVLFGSFAWFGGMTRHSGVLNTGRAFDDLPASEQRSLALVFDGLWAASAPLSAPRTRAFEMGASPALA